MEIFLKRTGCKSWGGAKLNEASKLMEAALKKAGVPVETLYYDQEGHGFYQQAHKVEYYTRLLAFLNRYLGGAQAGGSATAK